MNSIKCPECGLVNFATASECKRCHLSFESEPAPADDQYGYAQGPYVQNQYWPDAAEPQNQKKLFSGIVVVMTGFLAVAIVGVMIQQALHPLDPETAKAFGGLIVLIGLLLALLSHFWAIYRIGVESLGWALASLFVPFVFFIAVAQFWDKTRRSFVGQLVCMGIMFAGVAIGL
jgi:hypothetical protein